MATRKVTVTLDIGTVALAEQAAAREKLSLSMWLSKAARREAVRTGVGPAPVDAAMTEALTDEREHELAEEDLRAAG